MAKFTGSVGYVTQKETVPGVWSTDETTKVMKGDLIRQQLSHQSDGVHSNVALNHRVSLIGDRYAFENAHFIKWIEFNGVKWKVASVELQRPRLIVTLGGIWNGE